MYDQSQVYSGECSCCGKWIRDMETANAYEECSECDAERTEREAAEEEDDA